MTTDPTTLEQAITKYGGPPPHSRIDQVRAGGYGLADLCGYPDKAEIPDGSRVEAACYLFGQEAFGADIAAAYNRAVRRIDGEDVPPCTATGVVFL